MASTMSAATETSTSPSSANSPTPRQIEKTPGSATTTTTSYVRNAYAKIGVASRTQAVLRGVKHGLHIEHRRIDDWRVG